MSWKQGAAARRLYTVAALLGFLATLGGCSSVPDAINPVSWYHGVVGDDSGDQQPPAKPNALSGDKSVPNADKPYPSIGSVPDKTPPASTAAERAAAAKTLAADSADAHYTDMQIRRQTDESAPPPVQNNPPAPKPAVQSEAVKPKPPAAPAGGVPNWPTSAAAPAQNVAPPAVTPSAPAAPVPQRAATTPAQRPSPPAGPLPRMPAAPPPPPAIAAAPPAASAAAPPPPSQPASAPQVSSDARRRAATPEAPLVFGPPPPDIAIAQAAPPRPSRYRSSRHRSSHAPLPQFATGAPRAAPAPGEAVDGYGGGRVASVYFADGSAKLDKRDVAAIQKAIRAYKARGGTIVVVGHASSRTRNLSPMRHDMANFAISLDRANAVAREIMRLGVDPSAVQVRAVSDTQPAHREAMPVGEAANRRADILIEN